MREPETTHVQLTRNNYVFAIIAKQLGFPLHPLLGDLVMCC